MSSALLRSGNPVISTPGTTERVCRALGTRACILGFPPLTFLVAPAIMPSHKSFRTKITLAKAQKINRYVLNPTISAFVLLVHRICARSSKSSACLRPRRRGFGTPARLRPVVPSTDHAPCVCLPQPHSPVVPHENGQQDSVQQESPQLAPDQAQHLIGLVHYRISCAANFLRWDFRFRHRWAQLGAHLPVAVQCCCTESLLSLSDVPALTSASREAVPKISCS